MNASLPRFAILWIAAACALAPLHGVLPAIGSSLMAALIGAAVLYSGRSMRTAGVAVAIFCALLWLGQLTR